MIEVRYQLKMDEILRANFLVARGNPASFWGRMAWAALCIGIGISFFASGRRADIIPGIVGIIGGIRLVYLRLWARWRPFRPSSQAGAAMVHLNISADAMDILQQHSKHHLEWKSFRGRTENQQFIVLFLSAASFIILPKRIFTQAQLAELYGYLAAVAPSSPIAAP